MVITTGSTEKSYDAFKLCDEVAAVNVTWPVKPLTGATVKVRPVAVPPLATVTVAVLGVRAKSAADAEMMSRLKVLLEPKYVLSPEYAAVTTCAPELNPVVLST